MPADDHSAAISVIGLGILAFLATTALTADRYGEIVLRGALIDLDRQRRVRSQSNFAIFAHHRFTVTTNGNRFSLTSGYFRKRSCNCFT